MQDSHNTKETLKQTKYLKEFLSIKVVHPENGCGYENPSIGGMLALGIREYIRGDIKNRNQSRKRKQHTFTNNNNNNAAAVEELELVKPPNWFDSIAPHGGILDETATNALIALIQGPGLKPPPTELPPSNANSNTSSNPLTEEVVRKLITDMLKEVLPATRASSSFSTYSSSPMSSAPSSPLHYSADEDKREPTKKHAKTTANTGPTLPKKRAGRPKGLRKIDGKWVNKAAQKDNEDKETDDDNNNNNNNNSAANT